MSKKEKRLEMERYQNQCWYTFTVNPDDHMQGLKGNRCQIVRQNVIEFLAPMRYHLAQLELKIDISFPTALRAGSFPRIHYHGKVKFKDIARFLIKFDTHSRFSIEIDTIDDMKYWKRYMRKFTDLHDEYRMYDINLEHLEQEATVHVPDKANIVDMCKHYWDRGPTEESDDDD